MKTVRAVYENGVFRPTEPLELPEHSMVEFEPRPLEQPGADQNLDAVYEILSRRHHSGRHDLAAHHDTGSLGIRDEDWPDTPEEIARHLALMDKIEPLVLAAEEEAEWESARKARGLFEKAHFDEQAETLRRGWE